MDNGTNSLNQTGAAWIHDTLFHEYLSRGNRSLSAKLFYLILALALVRDFVTHDVPKKSVVSTAYAWTDVAERDLPQHHLAMRTPFRSRLNQKLAKYLRGR